MDIQPDMSTPGQRTGWSRVLRITKKVLRGLFAAVLIYYVFSYIVVQTVIGAIDNADPAGKGGSTLFPSG